MSVGSDASRRLRWLTRYGPEGASSRYRAFQVAEGLVDHGWVSEFEPLAPWRSSPPRQAVGSMRRAWTLNRLGSLDDIDAIVVQKEPIMPPRLWSLWRKRESSAPIVWDLDDAVWIGRSGSDRMAREMVRVADVVVAGNPLIADWAASYGADAVSIIPTCYSPPVGSNTRLPDVVEIVWIGSPATAPLLAPFTEQLLAIADLERVRLSFIGGQPPAALSLRPNVSVSDWSRRVEANALARADYGLALQERTPYSDHKCGFKIVQYLSRGVVPIVSDSPVHRWILDDVGVIIDELAWLDDHRAEKPSESARKQALSRWRKQFSPAVATRSWDELLEKVGAR